jgi:hypothetical protein
MVTWDRVTKAHVRRAMKEYDHLGSEEFLETHGFRPTLKYDLVWEDRVYPPKAILGAAYEVATGQRLRPGEFEGGRSGAVSVLTALGFTVREKS